MLSSSVRISIKYTSIGITQKAKNDLIHKNASMDVIIIKYIDGQYQRNKTLLMIEEKLNSLGVKLSNTQSPVGSFIPVVITGNLVFVSGQIAIEPGSNPLQVNYKGKEGRDVSLEDGRAAARVCIINGLSELKQALGSLDKVKKFVKVWLCQL